MISDSSKLLNKSFAADGAGRLMDRRSIIHLIMSGHCGGQAGGVAGKRVFPTDCI